MYWVNQMMKVLDTSIKQCKKGKKRGPKLIE